MKFHMIATARKKLVKWLRTDLDHLRTVFGSTKFHPRAAEPCKGLQWNEAVKLEDSTSFCLCSHSTYHFNGTMFNRLDSPTQDTFGVFLTCERCWQNVPTLGPWLNRSGKSMPSQSQEKIALNWSGWSENTPKNPIIDSQYSPWKVASWVHTPPHFQTLVPHLQGTWTEPDCRNSHPRRTSSQRCRGSSWPRAARVRLWKWLIV